MNAQLEQLQPQYNPVSTAARINQSLVTAIGKLFSILQPVPGFIWIGIAIAIAAICLFNGFSFLLISGMWILIVVFGLLAIAYGAGVCNDVKAMGVMGTSGKLPCLCSALIAILLFVFLPGTINQSSQGRIQRVCNVLQKAESKLQADLKNWEKDANGEPGLPYFERYISTYINTIQDAPIAGCPQEFKEAFQTYLFNLKDLDLYVKQTAPALENFWSAMWAMGTRNIDQEFNAHIEKLRYQWRELQRVALNYDVVLQDQ